MAMLLLGSAPAEAEERAAVSVSIEDCAERPMDGAELAARIAIELAVDPRDVVLDGAPSATQVRVLASCESGNVDLHVRHRGHVLTRGADLGDTAGVGRVWALALLVSELVRHARAQSEAEAGPHPRGAPQATDDEQPYRSGSRFAIASRVRLGVGALGRLYVEIPTAAAGLELALAYEWLRVAIAALATEAGSALGAITLGAILAEVALRPLRWTDGAIEVAGEVSASAGVAYAVGRPSAPGVRGSEAIDAVVGAALAGRLGGRVAPQTLVEVALSLGYDLLGPTYESSEQPLATLRGLRVGMALAVTLEP